MGADVNSTLALLEAERGLRYTPQMMVSKRMAFVGVVLGLMAAGCRGSRELREWKPSDHGEPPELEGTATEDEAEPARPDNEAATKEAAVAALWQVSCARCHGRAGAGDGTSLPPGAPIPDMTNAAWQKARSDEELSRVIREGRGLMPAFEDKLDAPSVQALVRHVRSFAAK